MLASRATGVVPALACSAFRRGVAGVEIFFLLSGFIIAHVHQHEFRYLDAAGWGAFRALRQAWGLAPNTRWNIVA